MTRAGAINLARLATLGLHPAAEGIAHHSGANGRFLPYSMWSHRSATDPTPTGARMLASWKMTGTDHETSGEVRVWADTMDKPAQYGELYDLLSNNERARAGRLRFERDRVRFVARRAFARKVLAGSIGTAPAAVRFRISAGGRPESTRRPSFPSTAPTPTGWPSSRSPISALWVWISNGSGRSTMRSTWRVDRFRERRSISSEPRRPRPDPWDSSPSGRARRRS